MANKADEDPLGEEEEGGPVKSFLDHLEDLRWTLIKCASVVLVGFMICLLAGNKLIDVLKRPLRQAELPYTGTNHLVNIYLGTNHLGEFEIDPTEPGYSLFGTNRFPNVKIVPVAIATPSGTNILLALEPDTNAPAATGRKLQIELINLSPAGGFLVGFQVALYGGVVLTSPFLIFFIGQFVVPAMKKKEKRYVYKGFAFGSILFLAGVAFCYFVLLRYALAAAVMYSNMLGFGATQWTAELYIGFVCKFMLGMGIGFEQPVILLALVKIGILDYAKLAAFRRYMIVINLVLGAVLTTPEVVTQILLAVPLQILYEITVWIAWYWERQERKRLEKEGELK